MEHNPIIAGGSAYLAVMCGTSSQSKQSLKAFFSLIGMRPCPHCKQLHQESNFYKNVATSDGLASRCKKCHNKNSRLVKEKYPEKTKETRARWTKENVLRIRDARRARYSKKKEEINQKRRDYTINRKQSDPMYKLMCNIKSSIAKVIGRGGYKKRSRTHDILGCDFQTFHDHIERQFTKGMSWDKVGPEIHIDHIIPLATAKTEADILALNHYTNLRPLWAKDNLSKADSIEFLI